MKMSKRKAIAHTIALTGCFVSGTSPDTITQVEFLLTGGASC